MAHSDAGGTKVSWGLRLIAGAGVAFLLSLGLCGGGSSMTNGDVGGPMIVAGVVCLIASAIGLFVGLVVALMEWLSR